MFTITVQLSIPQLDTWGEQLVASLNNITDALQQLSATLDQELTEIATALQNATPTQAEVDAVAQQVLSLRDRVQNIIP